MIKKGRYLMILIVTLPGCREIEPIVSSEIAGQWTITQVGYSGVMMVEWTGVHITFSLSDLSGGTYQSVDTPNDSIWHAGGQWRIPVEGSSLSIDGMTADFTVNQDELVIHRYLPWTAKSTCDNVACYLLVTGDWYFYLKRDPQ